MYEVSDPLNVIGHQLRRVCRTFDRKLWCGLAGYDAFPGPIPHYRAIVCPMLRVCVVPEVGDELRLAAGHQLQAVHP